MWKKRRISSFNNIPSDRDIYIYGGENRAVIFYDALSELGYNRIKGFVSSYEAGEFLGLPVETIDEYSKRRPENAALILAYVHPEVIANCEQRAIPDVFIADWVMAFMTVPELINERNFIAQHSKGAELSFDIGCNYAIMTMIMVDYAQRVISFDPNPTLHDEFLHNTEFMPQVELVKLALGDAPGKNTFYIDHKTRGGSSFIQQEVHEEACEVEIITLDDFCQERNLVPDFLKIDAEGFDAKVVFGGKNLITSRRPPMVLELWRHSWHLYAEAYEFLTYHYDFIDISTGNRFFPEVFARYAEQLADLGEMAGHTNIGCIPKP